MSDDQVKELAPIKTGDGRDVFPIQIERNGRLETINLTEPYYPGMKLPDPLAEDDADYYAACEERELEEADESWDAIEAAQKREREERGE